MGRVRAKVEVPQQASAAEALWYQPRRWPLFVDGFAHVVRQSEDWPRGGELVWDSTPDGRGRVMERVQRFEARAGQTVAVEDEQIRGTQTIRFIPTAEGCTIELELDYELKRETPGTAVFDVVFVRRPMRDALRRTLQRFARELKAEGEPPL